MPKLFLILMLCLLFSSVTAQNTPRLIEPRAEDYLNVLDDFLPKADTVYDFGSWGTGSGKTEFDVLTDEIIWRLVEQEQISYQQLLTVYLAYAADPATHNESDSDDRFIPHLVERWLTENPTELSTTPYLAFDGFIFDVRQIEHSGMFSVAIRAAPLEAIALFYQGFSGRVANFILVREDNGTYHAPSLPARMFSHVQHNGDFNDDQQSDFTYLHYDHVGNSFTSGSLYIVTWNGETFETLDTLEFRHGFYTEAIYDWKFEPFSDDSSPVVMQTQRLDDNWGCEFIRLTYFDWQDDGTLTAENSQDNLPVDFNCLLRQAEEQAWGRNFVEAIELYQKALAQPEQREELVAYAHMKLGLAYLLTGEEGEAHTQFSAMTVPSENPDGYAWVDEVRHSFLRDPRPLPVCQTIYNLVREIYDFYALTGTVYVSDGGFYGAGSYHPGINPQNLSCDLPLMLNSELSNMTFSIQVTPVAHLEKLGLAVADSISADFNSDGANDWLVWLESPGIDPLLFTSDGSTYALTILEGKGKGDYIFRSPDMRPSDEYNLYNVIALPDGSTALANIDFGTDAYSEFLCGGMCGGGGDYGVVCVGSEDEIDLPIYIGDLTLWRLEDGQLKNFMFLEMCRWDDIQNMLPGSANNEEVIETFIAADYFDVDEWTVEIRPVEYTWDVATKTFLAPPKPTPIPVTPSPTPTSMPVVERRYTVSSSTFQFEVRRAFAERDFNLALEMIDSALDNTEMQDDSLVTAFRYYRALTLEALNRPDDALAEYQAIYEAEPESAWGILAALHFSA